MALWSLPTSSCILPTQDEAEQRPAFCLTPKNQRARDREEIPWTFADTRVSFAKKGIEHGHLCKERMTHSGMQRR